MAKTPSSSIVARAVSRAGIARETNQDTVRIARASQYPVASHGHLFTLADGMGGYAQGDCASQLAAATLLDDFFGRPNTRPSAALRRSMENANEVVYTAATKRHQRMGTTLLALHLDSAQVTIAHIGDSRAYRLRKGQLTCLTRDHTPVGDLAHMNLLSDEQVRQHEGRSVLNRCLGLYAFVRPDIISQQARVGDLYLLCSDGFWSALRNDEIALAATLAIEHAKATGDPAAIWVSRLGEDLVRLARDHGSNDDRSVIVIWIEELPSTLGRIRRWPGRLSQLSEWLRHLGYPAKWES